MTRIHYAPPGAMRRALDGGGRGEPLVAAIRAIFGHRAAPTLPPLLLRATPAVPGSPFLDHRSDRGGADRLPLSPASSTPAWTGPFVSPKASPCSHCAAVSKPLV